MTKEEATKYLKLVLEQLEAETPPDKLNDLLNRFDDGGEILNV